MWSKWLRPYASAKGFRGETYRFIGGFFLNDLLKKYNEILIITMYDLIFKT